MRPATILSLCLMPVLASGAIETAEIQARLQQMPTSRPRLFLAQGAESDLNRRLKADPILAQVRLGLLAQANRILQEKPIERVLIGRRLLDKSRTCLSRVLHLSLAYRLTGDTKYAVRAKTEMLAAAGFSDWNPSHFLDVAEMTAALGIGYDWLFTQMQESDRNTIRTALIEKGLKPSLVHDSWSRATHNWNQVCNGGMAVGALAIAESEPALAAQIVARAINTVPLAMRDYGPDGAYPEGASYWSYGTTFNVILLSALQSTLGTDFGLSALPGFMQTADYYLHLYGPTGLAFNYSDAGSQRSEPNPAMFWFAASRKEPYLLWSEWHRLESIAEGEIRFHGNRSDPFLPLWMPNLLARPVKPPPLYWAGNGPTPVAFHRTGWDSNAVFIAMKGGSPATNHAHMDVGAFVMDADNTRWADDLGMQDYNSLESKGIDLWGRGQDAARWRVFRLGTSAHNVLMVDGAQQRYESSAPIVLTKPGRTIVDLTETYRGQLNDARRGIELRSDRTVLVQDEFSSLKERSGRVRWAMVTRADIKIEGPGLATLKRDGRTLKVRVLEPAGATLKIVATDPPPQPTDAPNPGTRSLAFEVNSPAGTPQRIVVQLVPSSARRVSEKTRPLSQW